MTRGGYKKPINKPVDKPTVQVKPEIKTEESVQTINLNTIPNRHLRRAMEKLNRKNK